MKNRLCNILGFLLLLSGLTSCQSLFDQIDDMFNKNKSSIIPSTYDGRPVKVLGDIHIASKNVTFYVWDSGQIDGDIITLVFNDKVIIPKSTLRGPSDKMSASVIMTKGYNYVLLFAHNEGSIPPNTAAISINDGTGEKNLVLSADLQTNGAYNIILD